MLIAIPSFGYQNHIAIDRRFGLIRRWQVTDAAAYEGARLREGLLDRTNTASAVWADTAYRSKENEAYLARFGFVSRIHRKKPHGRPMPERTRRARNRNAPFTRSFASNQAVDRGVQFGVQPNKGSRTQTDGFLRVLRFQVLDELCLDPEEPMRRVPQASGD